MVVLAVFAAAAPAHAGERPANLPPPGFSGQQFVDSKGCAFLRTETAGGPVWVPRRSRTGQPLCGFRPSFAPERRSSGARAPGTPPEIPQPPPAAALAPETADGDGVQMRSGLPKMPEAPQLGTVPRPARLPGPALPRQNRGTAAAQAGDRGQADAPPAQFAAPPVAATAPPVDPASHRYVQVGAFGGQTNAGRMGAQLEALGLPVYSRAARGLILVMAGPFETQAALDGALATLRAAGIREVILKD